MKLLSRNEEIVLLAICRLEDNAYGVTIRDLVSQFTGYEWTFGSVYVPLDVLTRRGYVQKSLSAPASERGGRSKCLYVLTREGKAALDGMRQIQESLWHGIPRFGLDESR